MPVRLDECFKHENQPIPPALSNEGLIRTGEKRDLLDCLPTNETTSNDSPKVDAKVFDGPAVVHYLQPGTCVTFDDYANDVFVPYMVNELSKVSRVDIVWDIYRPDSLKGTTRERRGTGTRRLVHASTRIPGNWQSFPRNDENKQELFRFLATKCIHAFTGCDAVSFFARHGKKSAWQTWEAYPDATEVFQMLSSKPSDITDDDLAVLERFLVLL